MVMSLLRLSVCLLPQLDLAAHGLAARPPDVPRSRFGAISSSWLLATSCHTGGVDHRRRPRGRGAGSCSGVGSAVGQLRARHAAGQE